MNTKNTFVDKALNAMDVAPAITVQKVTPINSKYARVTGTIRATASAQQLRQAVSQLGDRLCAVAGTFVKVNKTGMSHTVEGIVTVHQERIALTPEVRDRFKAVSSSMYLDEEEKIWNLKRTPAGDVLIRANVGDEDELLSNMLQSVASSSPQSRDVQRQASECDASRASIQGGDLAVYVGRDEQPVMGFVVAAVANADGTDAGLSMVSRSMEDVELIDRNQVVAFVTGNELELPEDEAVKALASGGRVDMDFIANYYRQVFMRDPAYFEKFMERFNAHVFA